MSRLPILTGLELIKILERMGFRGIKGDRQLFKLKK